MKLRSGKTITETEPTPANRIHKHKCRHNCENYNEKCCKCSDQREHTATYVAFNRSSLDQFSYVPRHHYYCPTCKTREEKLHPFTPPVPTPSSVTAPLPASVPAPLTLEQKYTLLEERVAKLEALLSQTNR